MADESQLRIDCVNVGADPDEGTDPGIVSYIVQHYEISLGIVGWYL